MSTKPNAALRDVLDRYQVDYAAFEALGAHSYEQALAARDPDLLEQCYAALFAPGKTLEQIRELCPAWPPGTKYAGIPPSMGGLSQIGTRIRTRWQCSGIASVAAIVESLKKALDQHPEAQTGPVVDILCNQVGNLLLAEQQKRQPVDPRMLALLLKKQEAETRARQQVEQMKLDRERLEMLKRKEAQADQAKAVATSADLSPAQKLMRFRQIFGMTT